MSSADGALEFDHRARHSSRTVRSSLLTVTERVLEVWFAPLYSTAYVPGASAHSAGIASSRHCGAPAIVTVPGCAASIRNVAPATSVPVLSIEVAPGAGV